MNSAIIVHGTCDKEEYFSDAYPSLSNSHWLPWLQKQLLIQGIFTQTPEMPEAYQPDYPKWKNEFERFNVDENTILVGHSCGGGFLVRWLSENKVSPKKLILVAPWLDPTRRKTSDFFDFKIDDKMLDRIKEIHICLSDDDNQDIKDSVQKVQTVLPQAHFHPFHDFGHFTFENMRTEKFPELLKIVVE